jgi:hypothetical protein
VSFPVLLISTTHTRQLPPCRAVFVTRECRWLESAEGNAGCSFLCVQSLSLFWG